MVCRGVPQARRLPWVEARIQAELGENMATLQEGVKDQVGGWEIGIVMTCMRRRRKMMMVMVIVMLTMLTADCVGWILDCGQWMVDNGRCKVDC